jgi:hypothetical protein
VFTARYGLIPYIKQITLRILKVNTLLFYKIGNLFTTYKRNIKARSHLRAVDKQISITYPECVSVA